MKVLVLGASGVVGTHFSDFVSQKHAVVRVARKSKNADVHLDVSDFPALASFVAKNSPDMVVNAVKPQLSVDEMETRRAEALLLNATLPEKLATLQQEHGFLLVQISTDGVYAGGDAKYDEESPVNPPNYYCRTKTMGEESVRKLAGRHLILRTEGVFGYDEAGTNFLMRLWNAEKEGKPFAAAFDQFSQPISGLRLAQLCLELVKRGKTGTYNATGSELVSRYSLAEKIASSFGWKCTIEKTSVEDRSAKVQKLLKVDVRKIERDVGSIEPLAVQIEELRGWFLEKHLLDG